MGDEVSDGRQYEGELRSVAKGGGLGMIGKVGQQTIAVVIGPVTARLLGAAGYGLLALGFGLIEMLDLFLSLGYPSAIVRYGAIYEGEGDRGKLRGLLAGTLVTAVALGLILATVLWFNPRLVSSFYPQAEGLDQVLRIIALAMPLKLVTAMLSPATIVMRTMAYRVLADLTIRPINLVSILILCWALGMDARGAALAMVIGALISLAIYAWGVGRLIGWPRPGDLKQYEGRKITAFALPMLLGQVSLFGLFRINNLIGGRWLSTDQVGQYQAASRIATFGVFGLNAIDAIIRPVLADMHHRGRQREMGEMFQTGTRWVWYMTLPVMLVAIFKARAAMAAFGPEFVQTAEPADALRILCGSQIAQVSVGNAGSLLSMTGYQWLTAGNNMLMAVLNIALCVVFTRRWGITGLSLASLVSVAGVNVLRGLQLWWAHRLSAFNRKAIKPVIAGAVTWPLLLIGFKAWPLDLFVPSLLFGLAYAGVVLKLGLEEDDRVIVRAMMGRLTGLRRGRGKPAGPPGDRPATGGPDSGIV